MTQKFHERVEIYADDEGSGPTTVPGPLTIALDNQGKLVLRNGAGDGSIFLDGTIGSVVLQDLSKKRVVFLESDSAGGAYSGLFLGAHGKPGIMALRDVSGNDSITLDGKFQSISLSNRRIDLQGINGIIQLNDAAGNTCISLEGSTSQLTLQNNAGIETIKVDGNSGDISLIGADCAEDFDVSEPGEMKPGTVMVIKEEGKLQQSMEAYDKRVAGVISGAGGYKPGIVLDKKHSQVNRKAVALMGKVDCKVDAQSSPIEIGDLLTTSSTPGHAMKAADPLKAFGAVIGKALRPLKTGKGIIPILVALQ